MDSNYKFCHFITAIIPQQPSCCDFDCVVDAVLLWTSSVSLLLYYYAPILLFIPSGELLRSLCAELRSSLSLLLGSLYTFCTLCSHPFFTGWKFLWVYTNYRVCYLNNYESGWCDDCFVTYKMQHMHTQQINKTVNSLWQILKILIFRFINLPGVIQFIQYFSYAALPLIILKVIVCIQMYSQINCLLCNITNVIIISWNKLYWFLLH